MVSVIDGVECIDIGPLKINVFFLSLAGKTVSKAVVDAWSLAVEEILNHK